MNRRNKLFLFKFLMLQACGQFVLLLFVGAGGVWTQASADNVTKDVSQGVSNDASNEIWHRVLHIVAGRPTIVTADFYVTADARLDAAKEMQESIRLLAQQSADVNEDQAFQCRFPYRTHVLERMGKIKVPPRTCPNLSAWRSALSVHQVSINFASSFLGNPASSFGHTFLKLKSVDRQGRPRHDLLNSVINYGASVTSTNPVSYVTNGLFGGFMGQYSIARYYEKIREYSHIENRDLWDFDLQLTQQQIDDLVDHLWELRGAQKRYYFLNRNCAFELLVLLQAIDTDLNVTRDFYMGVTPAATLRSLYKNARIGSFRLRPSREKSINQDWDLLDLRAKNQVEHALQKQQLSGRDSVAALNLLIDYNLSRFSQQVPTAEQEEFQNSVLKARLAFAPSPSKQMDVFPEIGPQNESTAGAMSVGAGSLGEEMGGILGGRIARKYFLEPQADMDRYSEFVLLDMRIFLSRESSYLQKLDLVNISSMPLSQPLFPHWSWRVKTGAAEGQGWRCERCLISKVSADVGKHWKINKYVSYYRLIGAFAASERLDSNDLGLRGPNGFIFTLSNTLAFSMELTPGYTLQRLWGIEAGARIHYQLMNSVMLIVSAEDQFYREQNEFAARGEIAYRF